MKTQNPTSNQTTGTLNPADAPADAATGSNAPAGNADAPAKPAKPVKPEVYDFGGGRYSNLMTQAYNGLQTVFGLDWQHAAHLAKHIASHVGAIMKDRPAEVKVGRSDSGGRLSLSEAIKIKGMLATPELSIMRALVYAKEAGLNGISYGYTKWVPVESVQQLFDKIKPE